MKIKEYITVTQYLNVDFDAEICEKLKEGFEIYGSPYSVEDNYSQAMVKYEEESKPDIKNRHLVDFETTWHSSDEYRQNRINEMISRGYEVFKKCAEPCDRLMHYKLMMVKYATNS